ncbi:MAG: hypothetical protein KKC75_05895 [Nanoarchaeota archaeon]|nr:hypothetical protein [Nanoarchaeota archaeon]MBU1946491.1 hypothetical protein [Nanoarchaeota archaeon]
MDKQDLIEKESELKSKIRILEWDKKMKQINIAKEFKLKEYEKELEAVRKELQPEQVVEETI